MRTATTAACALLAAAAAVIALRPVRAGSCSELRRHEGVNSSLARLHDLDTPADGIPEYGVSSPGETGPGGIDVHSGRTGERLFVVSAPVDDPPALNGVNFGAAIAPIADVGSAGGGAKDGVPDILIGAPRGARNNASRGYVLVASGADGAAIRVILGENSTELFGASVASPGDIDGDGWDDIAVGAPGVLGGRAGAVRFYSGKDGSLFVERGLFGSDPGGNLGTALAAVGDVDRDGVGDVAAGAPHANGTLGEVVFVSGAGGPAIDVVAGSRDRDRIGARLQVLPEFRGDRVLLVSSLEGQGFGLLASTRKRLFKLGSGAVVDIGDVDRDGLPDVGLHEGALEEGGRLLGYASAKLIGGKASKALVFACPSDPPGFAVLPTTVGLGDVDGDGKAEILLAEIPPGGPGIARVVTVDATPATLKRKVRSTFQRPASRLDASAAGTVELEVNKDLQRLVLKLKKLPPGGPTTFTVHLEDAPRSGGFSQVAQVSATAKGAASLVLEAMGAPPSELGIDSYADVEGRRLQIRDAGGSVVLELTLPAFAVRDNAKGKATLGAVPGGPEPSASAKVKSIFKGTSGASALDVKLKKADKKATYTVWIEDGPSSGSLVAVGDAVKARFQRSSAKGDPLPFGVSSALELSGRAIEIRDATGAVVVSGTLP